MSYEEQEQNQLDASVAEKHKSLKANDEAEKEGTVSLSTLAMTVLVAVAISIVCTMFLINRFVPASSAYEYRIVDVAALSIASTQRYKTDEEMEQALRTAFDRLTQMQKEGVVVLHAQSVLLAPPEIVLDPDILLPPATVDTKAP